MFNDWGIDTTLNELGIYEKLVLKHLHTNFEHFYQLEYNGKFIDFGTDGQHPGPKQHQAYADFLYEKLR